VSGEGGIIEEKGDDVGKLDEEEISGIGNERTGAVIGGEGMRQ
jgi:hypothetical protein